MTLEGFGDDTLQQQIDAVAREILDHKRKEIAKAWGEKRDLLIRKVPALVVEHFYYEKPSVILQCKGDMMEWRINLMLCEWSRRSCTDEVWKTVTEVVVVPERLVVRSFCSSTAEVDLKVA